jgi:amino acid adenylation domain-containing protein
MFMQLPANPEFFPLCAQQGAVLAHEARLGEPLGAFAWVRLAGALDQSRLRDSLNRLLARHEVLRTYYQRVDGLRRPVQSVDPEAAVNLGREEGPGARAQAMAQLRAALAQADATPLGAMVIEHSVAGFTLLLSARLASLDAVAWVQLAEELRQDYAGAAQEHDPDALQYIDYCSWQNELAADEIGVRGAAYWRAVVADTAPRLRLPMERDSLLPAQLARQRAEAGPLLDELALKAQALEATQDELLLFFWGAFLACLSDQPRVSLAVFLDGRNDQSKGILGRFQRCLPLNLEFVVQAPLRQALGGFRARLDEARSWLECLDESAVIGTNGLPGDYGFAVEPSIEGDWLELHLDLPGAPLLMLTLAADRSLRLDYAAERIDPQCAALWLEQFQVFAGNALADIDQTLLRLALPGQHERRLIEGFEQGQPLPPSSEVGLHALFERQVALYAAQQGPERIAVHHGEEALSYGELNHRANQLAHALRAQGIGRDQLVGVYAERGVAALVAVLGILKAGGAYLPLDPSYPVDRLSFMLADANAGCLLTLHRPPAELVVPQGMPCLSLAPDSALWQGRADTPSAQPSLDDLAYVIYTSGSTGLPKGVAVSHGNALASTRARFAHYREPVQSFLLLSSMSFDSSVAGIFWTLGQGGCLNLPTEPAAKDPVAIAALLATASVSHYLALPGLHGQVLEHLGEHSLRAVVVAGEACQPALVARHLARLPGVELSNEYGPTEGSVWCTAWTADQGPVSIGRPAPGMRVLLLDADMAPVAVGRTGELYVAGPGVARGYLGQPALTAERFLSIADGSRCYRTGDLARWCPDGTLEFIGRVDAQVKLRGFRIELGEVEVALLACDGVAQAAVVVREGQGGAQLAAFVVPSDAAEDGLAGRLQAQLSRRLPLHMVPTAIRSVERLPLMPNGKIDRLALASEGLQERAYQAPRNELERVLAAVWEEFLGVERVGIQDNFFELGGHSLLATRLRARLQEQLGIDLPLRLFFEGETLERFAQKVAEVQAQRRDDSLDSLENLFAEVEAP